MNQPARLESVRPLVRYVDEERAVVETHFRVLPAVDHAVTQPACRAVTVSLSIDGSDGSHDEGTTRLQLHEHRGKLQFDIVRPERWWPAGMGPQPLYTLTVQLEDPGFEPVERRVTFGLTSVRRGRVLGKGYAPSLLVNGSICDYQSILTVDAVHEGQLLPAAGETLLLVRDHFGPEPLYDAADRVGLLLIQCVPLHPAAEVDAAVQDQVDRLAAHPSLAGYFVGHWGKLSDRVASTLREQDPTRAVFRRFPLDDAA